MLSVSTSKAVEDTSNKQSNADNNDGDSNNLLRWMLIDCNNSNSILTAILLCLQECPLDARAHAVSNIFFSGEGVTLFPDIPQRVTKHLQQILRQPTNPSTSGGEETPSSSLASSSPSSSSLPPPPPPLSDQLLSIVPIDLKSLRSLESRIRLISCAPYRPDVVCWVGASLYATTWMKYDDEESPIPWIYQPRIK
jgi:actin-related protein